MTECADLLALPFDQYGRHRDMRDLAHLVRAHERPPRLAVLDVGGGPGCTARFLPTDWVVVVDPAPPDELTPTLFADLRVQASGAALPFPDATFDLVLSLDSLEHVPPADRPRCLIELLRVSGRYVLVLAPFASAASERAEALLAEYVKIALHTEHAQLREHRTYGLPDLDSTLAALQASGAVCHTFPSGALHHWLPLMLLKHYLLGLDPDAGVHAALDRWYNARDPAADRQLPAYRWGILASKAGCTPAFKAIVERFAACAPSQETELRMRQELGVVLHLLALERGNRGPAPLEARLAHQDRQLAALTHEVETLRAHLVAIRQGRIIRALNAFNHLLGRER